MIRTCDPRFPKPMRYQTALRPEERRIYTAALNTVNSFLCRRWTALGLGRRNPVMRPVIVLLTDFGALDPYVGQMKGVLAREAPDALVMDLCHEVDAHNIVQAGFLLQASHRHFPPQSIFLGVVDPGVGSKRSIVLARRENQLFLAPDNGLLSFLVGEAESWWRIEAQTCAASNTFHGRDIFAPLAARLALGEAPQNMGPRLAPDAIVHCDLPWAERENHALDCMVLHVDRFGNCLLNLRSENFPSLQRTWTLDDGRMIGEVSTYADLAPGQIGLLAGSQGVMELAVNQGSCARLLELRPGAHIRLTGKDTPCP
jgi:S-adenosyl-L-methionine hydrolase (adenosine-forming)